MIGAPPPGLVAGSSCGECGGLLNHLGESLYECSVSSTHHPFTSKWTTPLGNPDEEDDDDYDYDDYDYDDEYEYDPTCDLCGRLQEARGPYNFTDDNDWNAETGQHISCEQAHYNELLRQAVEGAV